MSWNSKTGKAAGGRLAAAVLATLAAPVAAYFSVRVAAIGMAPAAAAALPPADVTPMLRPLVQVAANPNGRATEEMRDLARQGLAVTPLAFEPFFIEAKAHEQGGRLRQAIALMEEARRRRASFLLTRLHLAAYYLQARRFREFLVEVDYALHMSPESRRVLLPELAKLVAEPEGRGALAELLASNPLWSEEFFNAARERRPSQADSLALLGELRERRGGRNIARASQLYLHSLVAHGEYRRARALALAAMPEQDRDRHALIFDGAFSGARGQAPFSWELEEDASGRAEILAADGQRHLEISYFGGSNVVLAQQTLALPPGRYQLRFLARSETGISSGSIFWALTCMPGDRRIARAGLENLRADYAPAGANFAVPAGCAGQQLRLMAEPGDVAAAVTAQLSNLEIRRAD